MHLLFSLGIMSERQFFPLSGIIGVFSSLAIRQLAVFSELLELFALSHNLFPPRSDCVAKEAPDHDYGEYSHKYKQNSDNDAGQSALVILEAACETSGC
jgi:hypothetical protein